MSEEVTLSEEVQDAVCIEPTAIVEEFARCGSDVAYFNEKFANALGAALEAKAERERLHGELMTDPDIAATLETRLGKRPTVDQLKGEILNLDEFQQAKRLEIRTEVEQKRLRGVLDAILAKRDGLISLGATMRLEMQQEMMIKE